MGKYLKQSFVRKLEIDYARDEITHSRMVELIEEEVIKNYLKEKENEQSN
jgi:hypothetical protein